MALIKCLKCGRTISDKAVECPNCGWVPGTEIEKITIEKPVIENNSEELLHLEKEKAELEKKVRELEQREPEVIDKTDYQTIESQKQEIQLLQQEKEALKQQLLIANQREPEIVDKTDYTTIEKQKKVILELEAEKEKLENQLQSEKNKEPEIIDKTDYQAVNNLEKEVQVYKKEREELLKKIEYIEKNSSGDSFDISKNSAPTSNRTLFLGMAAIVLVGVICMSLISSFTIKKAVNNALSAFLNNEEISESKDNGEDNSQAVAPETPSSATEESVIKEELATEQTPVNESYNGETVGKIVSGDSGLGEGVIITYIDFEVGKNQCTLKFRVTNNSDSDINVEAKKTYMNNVSVNAYLGSGSGKIPVGRAQIFETQYLIEDIEMAGTTVNSIERVLFNKDTKEEVTVLFDGININLDEVEE